MGRRRVAGAGQLALASLGFFLVVAWSFGRLWAGLQEAGVDVRAPRFVLTHPNALGWGGAAVFGVAWLWALVTSLTMIVRANPDGAPPPPVSSPPPIPPP